MSVKNKFVPCFFNANSELKFSSISFFKLSATLTGTPLMCGDDQYIFLKKETPLY